MNKTISWALLLRQVALQCILELLLARKCCDAISCWLLATLCLVQWSRLTWWELQVFVIRIPLYQLLDCPYRGLGVFSEERVDFTAEIRVPHRLKGILAFPRDLVDLWQHDVFRYFCPRLPDSSYSLEKLYNLSEDECQDHDSDVEL